MFFVIEKQGEVVGFVGNYPSRLKAPEGILPMAWSTDVCVHPDHRGWGARLAKFFLNTHTKTVTIGTASGDAVPIMARFGCKVVCRMQSRKRFVRPFRVFRAKGFSIPKACVYALSARAMGAWRAALAPRLRSHGITIEEIDRFDTRFDDFWNRVCGEYECISVRDSAFLNWRFVECPLSSYRMLAASRNGQLAGFVVFRTERRDGILYGHLVDLLASRQQPEVLHALVRAAAGALGRAGVDMVACSMSSDQRLYDRVLRAEGFVYRQDGSPVQWSEKSLGGKDWPEREWFVTLADSDTDMR
jgi:hypothetical protein